MPADPPDCRCGHPRDAHAHFRPSTACGICGPDLCPAYRRPPPGWSAAAARRLNRLFAVIRRR